MWGEGDAIAFGFEDKIIPGANISPIDLGTTRKIFTPSEYEDPMVLDVPKPGAELALTGVDVTTGAPTGRFSASFSKDVNYAAAYMQGALSEYYGQEIDIRLGPDSGVLEFLNPGSNKWTLADEARAAIADFQDSGHLLPAVGAIAGLFGGEAVGGPAAASFGSVIGAGLGEAARLQIGKLIGANEGITRGEIAVEAVEEGLLEALFVYGSQGIVGLRKFFKELKSPSPMGETDAIVALAKMDKNRQLAADVDALSRHSGPGFKPTTGQMADDEYLLGVQTAYTGDSLQASVQVSRRLNENETALEVAFDTITPATKNAYAAGEEAVEAVTKRLSITEEMAATRVARTTEIAERAIAKVPDVSEQATGRQMREAFVAARDVAKQEERVAYNAYKKAYGLDKKSALSNVKIPSDPRFTAHMNRISAEKINAIFGGQKTGKGQLLSDRLIAKKGDTIQLFGPDGKVISEFSKSGDTTIDLHQLEEGIKYLRRVARKSPMAPAPDAPMRDVLRLKDEMVFLRDEYLKKTNPELLGLALSAEGAAARRANNFDKSVLGAIIKKDGADYMLNDTRVFAYIIKSNDVEAARHFAKIVGQDPGATVAAKQGFAAFYKREVAETGFSDPKLHKKFMRDRSATIEAIFSKAEIKRMNVLGDMGKVVEHATRRYDNLVKALNKTFAGKIRGTSPENVVSTVFSKGFSAVETRRLMTLMDAHGSGPQMREAMGTYVRNKVFLNNKINSNNLERIIQQDGEKLKVIFDPSYVTNLGKISDGALMIRQTSRGLIPRKTNAFTDLMRVLFAPPLTRKGRAQTLLVNMRAQSAKRAIGEAIMNPKKLEAVIRLSEVDRQSKRAARILSAIGAPLLIIDSDPLTE